MNFPITQNHMTLLGFIYQLDMHPLYLKYTLSPLLLATKLKHVDNTDLKNNANTDIEPVILTQRPSIDWESSYSNFPKVIIELKTQNFNTKEFL